MADVRRRMHTSSTPTSLFADDSVVNQNDNDVKSPKSDRIIDSSSSVSAAAQCIQLCLLIDNNQNRSCGGNGRTRSGGSPATRSSGSPATRSSPKATTATTTTLSNNQNNYFSPVYTHQCFDDETIRGYQPATKITDNATAIGDDSNTNANATTNDRQGLAPPKSCKDIQITVHLAPSGRSCRVDMEISNTASSSNPHPKKRKRSNSTVSLEKKKLRTRTSPPSENQNENRNNREERKRTSDESSEDEEDEEYESPSEEEEEDEEGDDSSYTLNSSNDDDSRFGEEEDYENDDDNNKIDVTEGVTRKRRMPVAEIRERLSRALPTMTDDPLSTLQQDYLRRPIGTVLNEYETSTFTQDDQSHTFCLSLATGPKAADYHEQVQRLALLFIETADEVDVADETAGYWKVLYLFRKHSATKYSLAGYLTLFHFAAPFRKPVPGTVARICQVLLLPPYQRAGHGQVMLQAVADLAHGVYANPAPRSRLQSPSKKELKGYAESLVEVNVEDPAPGFTALRNRVDYVRFRQHHAGNSDDDEDDEGCPEHWIDSLRISTSHDPPNTKANDSFLTALTDAQVTEAATRAKITTRQIQIVYELYQLECLQRYTAAASAATTKTKTRRHTGAAALGSDCDEPEGAAIPSDMSMDDPQTLEKRYRLAVKKRLNKAHREELGAYRNKEEMKVALGELYDETLQGYQAILASVQRQQERARK
jgi:GNAT superfamily N-acetyltransferase